MNRKMQEGNLSGLASATDEGDVLGSLPENVEMGTKADDDFGTLSSIKSTDGYGTRPSIKSTDATAPEVPYNDTGLDELEGDVVVSDGQMDDENVDVETGDGGVVLEATLAPEEEMRQAVDAGAIMTSKCFDLYKRFDLAEQGRK